MRVHAIREVYVCARACVRAIMCVCVCVLLCFGRISMFINALMLLFYSTHH